MYHSRTPSASSLETPLTERCETPLTARDAELFEVRDFLVSLARRAGAMIRAAEPSVDSSGAKRNSSDRVTATDKAVEDMIRAALAAKYPAHQFLGEETFKAGQALADAPTFVCDPIDGTLNFIHGFPNIAVSLALTIYRRPVVAVVHNPFRNDTYTAVKGHGALLTHPTGRTVSLPLRGGSGRAESQSPEPLPDLNSALVAVEWGSERTGPNWALRSSVAVSLLSSKTDGGAMVHSLRSNGSAALDFCYVAAGYFDAFWEGGCWVWDVCAGWLIVEEAGGLLAGANPGEWAPTLEGRSYFCVRSAPAEDQRAIVQGVWDIMGDRKFVFTK